MLFDCCSSHLLAEVYLLMLDKSRIALVTVTLAGAVTVNLAPGSLPSLSQFDGKTTAQRIELLREALSKGEVVPDKARPSEEFRTAWRDSCVQSCR
jgi:hypothetical protein